MSYRDRDAGSENRSRVIVAVAGRVAAIDVQTGKELWRNEFEGLGHGVVEMLVEDGAVFVAVATSRELVNLDYALGTERWRAETSITGRASLLRDGTRLFVACDGYLDCFDFNGNKLWSNGLSGLGTGPTAVGLPGNVRAADDLGYL